MALVFMDSFDHYATDDRFKKWDREGGYLYGRNYIASDWQRRPGTKYLYAYHDHYIEKDVKDTVTGGPIYTFVIGAAIYLTHPGITGVQGRLELVNSAGQQLIKLEAEGSDGKLKFYIGTTLVEETVSDFLNILTWFHLEMKVTIHATAGSYEIKYNEILTFSNTGINTEAVVGAGVEKIRLYGDGIFAGAAFDDFYFMDGNVSDDPANPMNDFLGDCRIDCIYPDAAGDYTDFTPYPAAPNYGNTDDGDVVSGGDIDDDETYNESATVGHKEIYNLDSVVALGTPIYAAAQNSCMRKTDAGRRYVRQLIKVNGIDYLRDSGLTMDDGEWYLTDNYKVIQRPLDVNPNTGLAWTESDLNGVQSGVQVTV